MATASEDHTVRVWGVDKWDILLTLRGHSGTVSCVAFSPNDDEIATDSCDETISTYDLRTGDRRHIFELADGPVNTVQYSSQGDRLYCTSDSDSEDIWLLDTRSGALIGKYVGHDVNVGCPKLTHDNKYVVSVYKDRALCMFDVSEALY